MQHRGLSGATIGRLPLYLRALQDVTAPTITSEVLETLTGTNSAKIRKDLSHFGFHGTRGVGYNVRALRSKIERELGVTERMGVVIVGAGNIGRALANYSGFAPQGFRVVAICDNDASKIGQSVGTMEIRPMSQLESIVRNERVAIGIVATPERAAQEVADRFVAAGVTSLLNFAAAQLRCPDHVHVREVNLASELQILSFKMHQSELDAAPAPTPVLASSEPLSR